MSMKTSTKDKLDKVATATGWSQATIIDLALEKFLEMGEFKALIKVSETLRLALEAK